MEDITQKFHKCNRLAHVGGNDGDIESSGSIDFFKERVVLRLVAVGVGVLTLVDSNFKLGTITSDRDGLARPGSRGLCKPRWCSC